MRDESGVDNQPLYYGGLRPWGGVYKPIDEFEELDEFMRKYDVWVCVVDGLPETKGAMAFAKRFRGRVWLAYYNLSDSSQVHVFDENKQDEEGKKKKVLKVRINRTNACDQMIYNIENRITSFNQWHKDVPGFYEQMKAPKKVQEKNEKTGDIRYIYLEGNKADHYFHAEVYCDVAAECGKSKNDNTIDINVSIEHEEEDYGDFSKDF